MKELLLNPNVQAALVALLVCALNALAAWIKRLFPSQAKLVEDNWCYIQPVVDTVIGRASTAVRESRYSESLAASILQRAVEQFVEAYRRYEGCDPTIEEIDAAAEEFSDVLDKYTPLGGESGVRN